MLKARIPASLRPDVAGARYEADGDGPVTSASDLHGDFLVVGSRHDPTSAYFFEYLRSVGESSALIQLEHLQWDFVALCRLISACKGIYYREPGAGSLRSINTLTALRSLIMNHPNVIAPSLLTTNWSKPLQMTSISSGRAGMIVRGVETSVLSTIAFGSSEYVIKSMSNYRSRAVSLDDPLLWEQVMMPVSHPVQIQRRVVGENVRVHQIGSKVFACVIQSDRLDYRYGEHVRYMPIELPADIAEWCRRITELEGLRLAGIDLMRTPDGFVCLEINPMPGYDGFERHSYLEERPLSEALHQELHEG